MTWTQSLILDQNYSPCHVVGWQAAVTLLSRGAAEVLVSYPESIRSPSLALPAPAVLRLRRRLPWRRTVPVLTRQAVFARDGFACAYCGATTRTELTLDHVLPRCRGGASRWENLLTACRPCNHRKGHRTPAEAGLTPRRSPFVPRWAPVRGLEVERVPREWRAFTGG